jgi:hypothetical protein
MIDQGKFEKKLPMLAYLINLRLAHKYCGGIATGVG